MMKTKTQTEIRPKVCIFSMKFSAYLMLMGHVLIDTRRNDRDDNKLVFYFYDSVELREHMSEWINNSKSIINKIK